MVSGRSRLEAEEREVAARDEFKQRDTRSVHQLGKLSSLDDIRRSKAQQEEETGGLQPSPSKGQLPRVKAGGRSSFEADESKNARPALAAARHQLQVEKPEIHARMERTAQQAKIAQGNRKYKMDSLGVFEGDVNQIRAQSMYRVQMHQELSPVFMRMPNDHKDLKPAIQEDNVGIRLDKMFRKVCQSIQEPPQPARAPLRKHAMQSFASRHTPAGAASVPHSSHAHHQHLTVAHSPSGHARAGAGVGRNLAVMSPTKELGPVESLWSLSEVPSSPSMAVFHAREGRTRSPDPHYYASSPSPLTIPRGGVATTSAAHGSICSPMARSPGASGPLPSPGLTQRSTQLNGKQQKKAAEWSRLPTEVAQAHLQRLADKTEGHLERYHAAVVEAQERLLMEHGLPPEMLGLTAEEVEGELIGFMEGDEEEQTDETMLSAASQRLKHAANGPDLVSAAIQHIEEREASLEEFKQSMHAAALRPLATEDGGSAGGGATARFTHICSDASRATEGEDGEGPESGEEDGEGQGEGPGWRLAGSRSRGARTPSKGASLAAAAAAATIARPPAPMLSKSQSPAQPPLISQQRITLFKKKLEVLEAKKNAHLAAPGLPLLPEAPTASLALQSRLERIWNMLGMPLVQRLDMVMEYTKRERVLQFEQGLLAWEKAASAVLRREELLSRVMETQQGLETGGIGLLSIKWFEKLCCQLTEVTGQVYALSAQLRDEFGSLLEYQGRPYPGTEGVVGSPHLTKLLQYMEAYQGPVKLVD